MPDHAFVACDFTRKYSRVWDHYFPDCVRRAHWQIARLVRMSEDGELFSVIAGHANDTFGMSEEACIERLEELVQAGLIRTEGEKIYASTCVYPTTELVQRYDSHVREAVELLCETARLLDPMLSRLGGLVLGSDLNKRFGAFFADYRETINESRQRFLKTSLPTSKSLQVKALRSLMTYAYWHIYTVSWLHQHPDGGAKDPFLLIDNFQPAIFEHTGVTAVATKSYITNMIRWGFLERLDRKSGVKKGRFAVRMPRPVFEFFYEAHVAAAKVMLKHATEFCRMSAASSTEAAAVIGFRLAGRENVSETSPISDWGDSRKKI